MKIKTNTIINLFYETLCLINIELNITTNCNNLKCRPDVFFENTRKQIYLTIYIVGFAYFFFEDTYIDKYLDKMYVEYERNFLKKELQTTNNKTKGKNKI